MKYLISSLGLVLFFSCTDMSPKHIDAPLDGRNILSQEEEKIKASLINMWDAIENEDIDRYASYVHPDFTQFGENDPILKIGKNTEVEGVADWVKNSSNIHTEMEEPRIVVVGDVGWVTYYWKDSGTINQKAFSSRGKSTRIFVKEDGRWLCIHGHYTLLQES